MKTINSSKITVFPSISRKEEYTSDSCLLTEDNITKSLRYLFPGNNASFVNTCDFKNNRLRLIIYGYCFNIDYNFSDEDKKNLYACIFIKDNKLCSSDGNTLTSLDNENNEFTGIYFANSLADLPAKTATIDRYDLCIVKDSQISKTKIITDTDLKLIDSHILELTLNQGE